LNIFFAVCGIDQLTVAVAKAGKEGRPVKDPGGPFPYGTIGGRLEYCGG
jgi:hypothetical protein